MRGDPRAQVTSCGDSERGVSAEYDKCVARAWFALPTARGLADTPGEARSLPSFAIGAAWPTFPAWLAPVGRRSWARRPGRCAPRMARTRGERLSGPAPAVIYSAGAPPPPRGPPFPLAGHKARPNRKSIYSGGEGALSGPAAPCGLAVGATSALPPAVRGVVRPPQISPSRATGERGDRGTGEPGIAGAGSARCASPRPGARAPG